MRKYIKLTLILLFLGFYLQGYSQDIIEVSGNIRDSQGEPIIGVTILVTETKKGTISDIDGNYTLKAERGNTIQYTYVGYKTIEKKISSNKIDIVMDEDSKMLDEFVVIGYGIQKKSDLTGSLSSVKGDDLAKSASSNISQALQGKASGVYVTSNSGAPGSSATIRVRGFGSIGSGTSIDPLYVVDGQPTSQNTANMISSQDIESIEILKDASACAIFGARGANGVILITTKQGKEGKTRISLDASFGYAHATNKVKMMNSDQLYNFLSEAYKNDGTRMPRNITRLYTLDGEGLGPVDENGDPTNINVYNTNWWNETTRTGAKQNYNLQVSSGTDKLKSHFSVGYYTEDGILKTSDFQRINARTNNEYKFNKYITIGQTFSVAYIKSHDLNMPINEILLADPFTPILAKDVDPGSSNYEYNKYLGSQYSYYGNPVAVINRVQKEHITRNISGTAFADINLGLKGLQFKTMVGYELPNYSYTEFTPYFDISGNDTPYNMSTNVESKFLKRNSLSNYSSWGLTYSLQHTLTYANTFGKHDMSAMVGYTWESEDNRYHKGETYDLPSNKPPFHVLDSGIYGDDVTGNRSEHYLISYLARLNYGYDDKYLLTASMRRDGSSNFARGNRWGIFPSFSLGWKVENEPFFKNLDLKAVSGVKVRAGWGRNGNESIGSHRYANVVSSYETWIYAFNSANNLQQGYALTSVGNPDVKWETSEQTNVGVDFSFFNNALTFTGDFYIKKTVDMLAQLPVVYSAGYPTIPYTNAGNLRNVGWEFLVGYKGKVSDFNYSVNANISLQSNKLVATANGEPLYGNVTKSEVGDPVGRYYGLVYDGIFQSPEEVQAHVGADGTTVLQPTAKAGDFRFRNLNNDNSIDENDYTYIGNPLPKVIYGGSINLEYKGIDLALYIQGVAGNDIWVGTKNLMNRVSMTNLLAETYTDAWRQAGDKTDVPAISLRDDNNNMRTSSWYVEDGSFCKLKTLQLGYTLPDKLIKKAKVFQSARFYVSAENLLTITKFKYMDPEVTNTDVLNLGMESTSYPNPRTISFGFNVQF